MTTRTFLALNVDEAVRRGIRRLSGEIAERLDPADKVSWVHDENLHVTLNFLGNVPDDILADVCQAAIDVAADMEPFDFHIRNVAAVPEQGRQLRVIWLDIEEPSGVLADLQQALTDAMVDLGMRQEERVYRPHLTLARVKYTNNADALRRVVGEFAPADFGTQFADEVVVYSSVRAREGVVYAPIARATLGEK